MTVVWENIKVERRPPLLVVTLNRPQHRNAVDGPTAQALAAAFRDFDKDPELRVAILRGGFFTPTRACSRGEARRRKRRS